MIRLAKIKEIDQILSITSACASQLISKSIFQWSKIYPSEQVFRNDIENKELYVLIESFTIIGTIVLTPSIDPEYKSVKWLTQDQDNLYVHRLAIHPSKQGKGYARKLMDFAEGLAISNGYASIRLDTFSKNLRNQKFYELRGYQRLGNVYFLNQSKDPFYCYELVLNK
jgi:ribosomal protein S18 acetylase RimI-like enzyme